MTGLGGSVLETEKAKAYLQKTNLGVLVEDLLQHLVERQPEDAVAGIADWAQKQQASRRMDFALRRGTQLDHNIKLDINLDTQSLQGAVGIVATIGPVSQGVEQLSKLLSSGVSIVRMNFSHGDHAFHAATIANARAAADSLQRSVALAVDTKGPEIRTGDLKGGGELTLARGDTVRLTTDPAFKTEGTAENLFVDYAGIAQAMEVGQHVCVDDGILGLRVTEKGDGYLVTEVVNPHTISSRRGVNLPHVVVDLPAVSEKDKDDLRFAAEQGVDMVFASFIRKGAQVREVRDVLRAHGADYVKIISKIENHEGLENFDDILRESDGIMVARGDLGTEIPIEKVFVAQKMMIGKCNAEGKPCIVATQMLESMTNNPRPTRAEASDVANAVLDGADLVMLSGETAKGKFGEECVSMMRKVTVEAQASNREQNLFESIKALRTIPIDPKESIASSVVSSAYELHVAAIIALTNTGSTASLIAKYRPPCPIVAVTNNSRCARQLLLHRFVKPLVVETDDREGRMKLAIHYTLRTGLCKPGDRVVLAHAGPQTGPKAGYANLCRIVVLGEIEDYETDLA